MKIIKRKFKRIMGIIADLHMGSPYSPWPEYKTDEGVVISPSPGQTSLLDSWLTFCDVLNEWQCDTILLNGDMCDGNNRREWGRDAVQANLDVQIKQAFALLKPICDGRKIYGVAGSAYHDSLDTITDRRIIEALGGQYLGLLANFTLEGSERVFNVAHGESAAAIYRTTIMDRESLFMLVAEARKDIDFHVDCVIRGHWHRYLHLESAEGHFVQCPGWKDWYPFRGGLKSYGKVIPNVGGVIIAIDSEDRLTIHHFLYPRPKIQDYLRENL